MSTPAGAPRSRAFSTAAETRFWWHRVPRHDYVPPIYAGLTDAEWNLLSEWYAETSRQNLIGECAAPIMSLLHGLIMGNGIHRLVQLGTFSGYSTLLLGFFLRQMGAARGLCTFEIGAPLCAFTQRWLERADLTAVVRSELCNSLDPVAPEIARAHLGGAPELIFIDSSHEYENTLAELEAWYPHLAPGGFVVLHDSSEFAASFDATKAGGVSRAFQEWREAHPEAETFSINRHVCAQAEPGMIYQDFCGAGLIQKPA